jgi:hypothetical protein
MLKVTLGDKEYMVNFVSALALREIQRPIEVLARNEKGGGIEDYGRDVDTLVKWFCLMFHNQFTPEDVYEFYPADRLIPDIALAVLAVKQQVSQALKEFPTKTAAEEARAKA